MTIKQQVTWHAAAARSQQLSQLWSVRFLVPREREASLRLGGLAVKNG